MGQTNDGKTQTIAGDGNFEERGLAPRAVALLFREIKETESSMINTWYEVSRC